ncbi:unnamed protein product [Microthlaspi erraticum]|uniref:SWIM-type domain-containing protein n=1 Tax=Microthlaspi erraticum TaxID=1685480 RepID=A0A6D2KP89_9BRAS|nr:unnamed protein product [Microthlaspi erraticum]
MAKREVLVMCYWNGCIKYGPDGVYYEASTPKKIRVKGKTELSRLLDRLYLITGSDKQRSKLDIFGKYPFAVSPNLYTYVYLPVVNDTVLETMLEVPSKHPSINTVELYLEVKPTSDDVVDPAAAYSSPLDRSCSSSKRQRTQPPPVKLERDNEDEANAEFGNGSTHGTMALGVNSTGLEASANECLNKSVGSSASKPLSLSSLWVDDHELHAGLCFKDRDELKKAVEWFSIRGQQKFVEQETKKDEYTFECIRWKCKWSLYAARREEQGECVEITKYTGPHTCSPKDFEEEFLAEEIERVVRVNPTLSVSELKKWWKEKTGYKVETSEMKEAKLEALHKVCGDWEQSFRTLPKLMAALRLSNGLVVDWQYDPFPNPEFASFRGVFWAFSQSIEGFQHCKPLIIVGTKDLKGKYPMKLMVALGTNADGMYFPLAFAVTKEVSLDSWRWFFSGIREKVTQRKGLCLISSPHPDILAVINEPGSRWQEPWAYHRFCLYHLRSQFHDIFKDGNLSSLVKKAGSTDQEDEFDSHMDTIKKENIEAWRWLDKMAPHQWALAHDGGRRYGNMTTKINSLVCESFQSVDLGLPGAALLLFDDLRLDFQNCLSNSLGRLKRGGMYTKPVTDRLEEFRTASVTYVVMPLDNNAFQVTTPLLINGWIVELSKCTCTCGGFQEDKFPCLHALSVLSAWPETSAIPTLFPPVILPPPPSTSLSGKGEDEIKKFIDILEGLADKSKKCMYKVDDPR